MVPVSRFMGIGMVPVSRFMGWYLYLGLWDGTCI